MTERAWARLAGFLFVWLIVTGAGGQILASRIAGSGTFTEIAQRIAASQHLCRLALLSELVETLSALLLAFALYVILRNVDQLLAQLAMYWRFAESVIGCIGMMFAFARLRLYTTPSGSQPLIDLTKFAGTAAYHIGVLCFSLGSILFFYVFKKSRWLPKWLSIFGVIASAIVTLMTIGNLLTPEYGSTLNWGWLPIAVAEVLTGVWLMRAEAPESRKPRE